MELENVVYSILLWSYVVTRFNWNSFKFLLMYFIFFVFQKMLIYDPVDRISAKAILRHRYFNDLDKSGLPSKNFVPLDMCDRGDRPMLSWSDVVWMNVWLYVAFSAFLHFLFLTFCWIVHSSKNVFIIYSTCLNSHDLNIDWCICLS